MTALAGFWSTSGRPVALPCAIMLSAQSRYGPDSSASLEFGRIAMGRNLFALLPEDDLDRQPLVGGNGRFVTVADVRLDNRADLASALGLTPLPKLADSEILHKALERWGDAAPDRLLGDFAFAFFDRHENRLLLGRDPLGQRPLFWHRGRDFIAFASMPTGLHALDEIDRHADPEAVVRFLANRHQPPGQSYFAGLERVPPGHIISVTPDTVTRRRYWNPQRQTLRLARFEDYVEAYRSELEQAVRCRMRTRAPIVATHLSGGWDSGAVTATAARLNSHPLAAFTAVPARDDPALAPRNRFADEGPRAAAVAAMHPNLEHHLIESDATSPLDRLEEGVRWFERPLFNLCNHGWLAQIRESARERGAQVLLSGEIGNWTISAAPHNLLAEYLRERGWHAWLRAARSVKTTEQARWRGVLATSLRPWLPSIFWRGMERLSSNPGARPALHPGLLKALPPEERHRNDRFDYSVEAFFNMDFGDYRKGILGGWGIDKRDATADVRLVEFCLSLPTEMLLNSGGRRPLARAALADRLPPEVLDKPGKGYQGADWHRSFGRDLPRAHALIKAIANDQTASSVVDVERLRTMLDGWPPGNWNSFVTISLYRNLFLQALTAGHFLIRASGGKSPW